MKKTTTKIPNDLVDKYIDLFKEAEQMKAVLDLIKQSYGKGYEDGSKDEYRNLME